MERRGVVSRVEDEVLLFQSPYPIAWPAFDRTLVAACLANVNAVG